MDKLFTDERKRKWQPSTGLLTGNQPSHCLSCFCPCLAYGRSSARLRTALGGGDALTGPNIGILNPDCVQFAVCFPFYGCFVAKLQSFARDFYGIDGSDVNDWFQGCVCPCLTITRNERQILAREMQNQRLKEGQAAPVSSQYRSQDPIRYPKQVFQKQPNVGSPEDTSATTIRASPVAIEALDPGVRGHSSELERNALPMIPEVNRESQSPSHRERPVKVKRASVSSERNPDPEPDTKAEDAKDNELKRFPSINFQGKTFNVIPIAKKVSLDEHGKVIRPNTQINQAFEETLEAIKNSSHSHGLGDHEPVVYLKSPHPHSLEDHEKFPQTPKSHGHRLDDDQESRSAYGLRSKNHDLTKDPSLMLIASPLPHDLDSDDILHISSSELHQLFENRARRTTGDTSSPHRLEADEVPSAVRDNPSAHNLEDHPRTSRHLTNSSHRLHHHDSDRTVAFDKHVTTHFFGQKMSPPESSAGESETGHDKSTTVKQQWKSRFGRSTKFPKLAEKIMGRADDSSEASGDVQKSKQKEPSTIKVDDDRKDTEQPKPVVTHELNDHETAPMRYDTRPTEPEEKREPLATHTLKAHALIPMEDEGNHDTIQHAEPVITHLLNDHAPILMVNEMQDAESTDKAKPVATHALKDDAMVILEDETQENRLDKTSTQPDSHLLQEDVSVPVADDAQSITSLPKSRRVSVHTLEDHPFVEMKGKSTA